MSAIPRLCSVQFSADTSLPLLVLGPSLGTSAVDLWAKCAGELVDAFHVVAWDLPGHGVSPPMAETFDITALAAGVLDLVDQIQQERGGGDVPFHYAGDSIGGAVGLELLLDSPDRVRSAALLCTGGKIGDAQEWRERAEAVRTSGTSVLVESAPARWFSPGFVDRCPEDAANLLLALRNTDRIAYARACEALAEFDVRDRLGEIAVPILAIAGADDKATPAELLREIATTVQRGRLLVLSDVAHLAPIESPVEVAQHIRAHFDHQRTMQDVQDSGMAVRRQVLGDAHVDKAILSTTAFTAEFQDLITQYAWGTIWTRPGLDRRSRSLITLTALIARGHHEELAMHLRAAHNNGVTSTEIKELILQSAIYCGVPDANNAFKIAQRVEAARDDSSPPSTN